MTPTQATATRSRSTAAKKRSTAAKKRSTAAKKQTAKEPVALKRFNRSLENAQEALRVLGKDVSKDVDSGTRALYKDLESFVAHARRDSRKLGKALERDVRRAQKKLAGPR